MATVDTGVDGNQHISQVNCVCYCKVSVRHGARSRSLLARLTTVDTTTDTPPGEQRFRTRAPPPTHYHQGCAMRGIPAFRHVFRRTPEFRMPVWHHVFRRTLEGGCSAAAGPVFPVSHTQGLPPTPPPPRRGGSRGGGTPPPCGEVAADCSPHLLPGTHVWQATLGVSTSARVSASTSTLSAWQRDAPLSSAPQPLLVHRRTERPHPPSLRHFATQLPTPLERRGSHLYVWAASPSTLGDVAAHAVHTTGANSVVVCGVAMAG